MSEAMNKAKQHAMAHVAKLAEPINKLVGQVIAKGLTGILEECIEMKCRIAELEAQLEVAQPTEAQPVDKHEAALQELADQAQELDMGYGHDACPKCGRSQPASDQLRAAVRAALEAAAIRGRLAQLECKVVDIEILALSVNEIIAGMGK
jgi:hypothetical protein